MRKLKGHYHALRMRKILNFGQAVKNSKMREW